jgi:ubiquinone/menaquinone biosynthesis C-methylase UbiE
MTTRIDYDCVASGYSSRYRQNDYSGVAAAVAQLCASEPVSDRMLVLEVGCGTGFWLQAVQATEEHRRTRILGRFGVMVVGIDPSSKMLEIAQATVPTALLARAQAEALPFRSDSVDRLFCINALHHFTEPGSFFMEARRVLRPGGAVLTVGLDPHTGLDQWWVYDYFPEALIADRKRYLPTPAIRGMMAAVGFARCETREVQHSPRQLRMAEAERGGFLARASKSQLLVISDEEYESGLARIRGAVAGSPDELVLSADLRLYGTTGWRAG